MVMQINYRFFSLVEFLQFRIILSNHEQDKSEYVF